MTTIWSEVIRFVVYGIPVGQPRMRAFTREVKNGRHISGMYTPPRADDWKARIIQEAQTHLPAQPLTGPIRVDVDFYFPRPADLMRKKYYDGPLPHTKKPDRDNCDKCVLDALTQVRLISDDKCVCAGTISKWYHAKDGRPGAEIVISQPDTAPAVIDINALCDEDTLFGKGVGLDGLQAKRDGKRR